MPKNATPINPANPLPLSTLADLGIALDQESYEWLEENRPDLASALDLAVKRGARPSDIRRFVITRTARMELALRCEQYARAAQRIAAA